MDKRTRLIAAIAVMAGAACALGVGITPIGVLTPFEGGTVDSRVYAISPDGAWAVGSSNGQNVAGTATLQQAVAWSSASGLVQLPNTPDGATHAHGVVVKPDGDVGVGAYYFDPGFNYRMASYTASPANLTGGVWAIAPGTHNNTVGTYNAARSVKLLDGSIAWVIAGQRANGAKGIVAQVGSTWYTDYAQVGSVIANSPSGGIDGTNRFVAAGYDKGNAGTLRRALHLFTTASAGNTVIPGGSLYQSEALGISVGATRYAGVLVGYDQDATAAHNSHAFYWKIGDAAMTILPELPGDTASTAIDVKLIGGNWRAAGYSSNGTTESAVLWNWGGSGATGLMTMLTSLGVDMSAWSSLSRATSMSDDGLTIGGWGIWAADGSTRGFIATIPEPATLWLLAMGLLVARPTVSKPV